MQFGIRTILFVMLLVGMLIFSYAVLFKPLKQQRDDALADTRQKKERLEALSGTMKDNKDMTTEIDKLRTAIGFLEGKLPKETEMDHVLQDVWKAAKDNNLNIKSVRNGKSVEGTAYSQQPIRMVVEGPFHPSFFKFLSTVEGLDRLTKISDMKIDADEKSTNGSITADFTLTIYYENSVRTAVAQ
jgi:type IV pilus assembly protein PilO